MCPEIASQAVVPVRANQPRPRIAAQGVLYLDESLSADCCKMDFVQAVVAGHEKFPAPWRWGEPKVGGMPAHIINSAAAKGMQVALRTRLPQRLLAWVSRFLDEHSVDLSEVIWERDAPVSRSMQMQFLDGQISVVHSAPGAYDLTLPTADYDLLLINPGSKFSRRLVLQEVQKRSPATLVGLMARGDWSADDYRSLDQRHVVFLNLAELTQSAKLLSVSDPSDLRLALLAIGELTRATVFVTLGEHGCSMLSNRAVRRVTGARVPVKNLVGLGDTFCFTTCLALLAGESPERAGTLGNLDAARVVEGQSPAASLCELYAMAHEHPEVAAVD